MAERIPNLGSKVTGKAKAISLAFVLFSFEHAGVRIVSEVYETECRHVAIQRGECDQNCYSTEAHGNGSDLVLGSF